MKKVLNIATTVSLALLFCCNSAWAGVIESGIAPTPEPKTMFLFGMGLLGLAVVSRFKFKN
jgi:hypothetical protein